MTHEEARIFDRLKKQRDKEEGLRAVAWWCEKPDGTGFPVRDHPGEWPNMTVRPLVFQAAPAPASGGVEANPEWEAKARALREADEAADPENYQPDATVEGLIAAATMLDTWLPDSLPANEHGQVHFARAMGESVSKTIRAYVAALSPSKDQGGDEL